jgi:CRISPR type III-associated protein (TIGR04423 family)
MNQTETNMEGITIYTNLNDISSVNYEGYIWMSDETEPTVLNNKSFDFSIIETNPFIVEALLFDAKNKISIHVTHDGAYKINSFDLNKLKEQKIELVEKEYLPHRLKGVEKVHFVQLWKEENDPLCNDFPVLELKATVFCGFKKLEL